MLKKIGVALVVVIAVLLVVPAFLPSKVHIERTAEYNAPASKVFGVLSDMNQFAEWNPWKEMEPSAKIEVAGQGLGSTYAWEGEKTGSGKMTVSSLTPDQNVQVKMDFYEPMSGNADVQWKIIPNSDQSSKVVWEMDQELPYLNRYFGLAMDKM